MTTPLAPSNTTLKRAHAAMGADLCTSAGSGGGDDGSLLSDTDLDASQRSESPATSGNAAKRQRRAATWDLPRTDAERQQPQRDWPFPLALRRVLAENCQADHERIQVIIALVESAHAPDVFPAPMVAKLMGARCRRGAHDPVWRIREECEAAALMSSLVEQRVAPGLARTHLARYGMASLALPDAATDPRWENMAAALRRFLQTEAGETMTHGVIVSEFISGGLAHNVMRALAPSLSPAAVLASLYGQLQWTLAAVHALGIVHSDVHRENILVQYVDAAPNTVFELAAVTSGVRYRFLAPGSAAGAQIPLLKLIDYGVVNPAGCELLAVPTMRAMRAPEFFGAYSPVRPDKRVNSHLYTTAQYAADTWSSAMTFLTILCGGIVPGNATYTDTYYDIDYAGYAPARRKGAAAFVLPEELRRLKWTPPRGFVTAFGSQIAAWKRMAKNDAAAVDLDELSMIESEESDTMATQLWRTAMLCGLPTPAHWPDVAHMPLMTLLRPYDPRRMLGDAPLEGDVMAPRLAALYNAAISQAAPDMSPEERADLGALLAQQLQWDPAKRPRAHQLLQMPAMRRLCRAEEWPAAQAADAPQDKWTLCVDNFSGCRIASGAPADA